MLSTCNRTEVYVVAERFHAAYADLRNFLSELAFLPPEDFADHLYVHYDADAASPPVRGGRRARLGGDRRGRDPRPGPPRLGAGAGRGRRRFAAQPAVPPRPRGRQAGPHRDRHRPPRRLGLHRGGGHGRRAPRLARRPAHPRARRRRHGRGHGPLARRQRASTDIRIANRTWERAAELAERVGGRAIRLADLDASLAEVDLLLTSTGASSMLIEHADIGTGHGDPRRPPRCSSSTWPCPATSTRRRPTCRASPCSTWTTCGPSPRPARPSAAARSPAVRAMVDDELERYLAVQLGPRGGAAGRRPARAGRGRSAGPSSTASGPVWASSTSASSTPSRRSPTASWPSCCTSPRWGSRTRPARRRASAWPRPCATCSTC